MSNHATVPMAHYVQMPADLACFLQATKLAHEMVPAFARRDITRVEAAWQIDDLDNTSFGWVVALDDGRRFYLEYTMEDAEAGRPEDMSIASMAAGQSRPELDNGLDIHWYEPTHINRHLGLAD